MTGYWIKIGDGLQPSVHLNNWLELKIFLFGVFAGDGMHTDSADDLAEEVADHMDREGGYPERKAVELKDGRPIYVWLEKE